MHELENDIEQWRDRLRATGRINENEVDELESHLRDSVDDLSRKGLSPAEAFAVARMRLGTEDALASEFGKADVVRVWVQRAKWMLIGSLVLELVWAFYQPVSLVYTGMLRDMERTVSTGVMHAVAYFVLPVLYAAAVVFFVHRFSLGLTARLERVGQWCGRRPRMALAIGVLLCCVVPVGLIVGASQVAEGVRRLFAETPGAVRHDWTNILMNVVGALTRYGPIGAVIWWLYRWECRRTAEGG